MVWTVSNPSAVQRSGLIPAVQRRQEGGLVKDPMAHGPGSEKVYSTMSGVRLEIPGGEALVVARALLTTPD